MPVVSVITLGTYVLFGKSSGLPTASQRTGGRSNSALPTAKTRAGSVKAATAVMPAPCAVSVMKRRRVTVSPSNAPGTPRSAVYLDLGSLRVAATTPKTISTAGRRPPAAAAPPSARRPPPAPSGPRAARFPDGARARLRGCLRGLRLALGGRLRGARDHAGQD